MTDIAERLHTIRDHLRTGRFGQREVWEEWLAEAAAEIERLDKDGAEMAAIIRQQGFEIERLTQEADQHLVAYQAMFNDNERLLAALQEIEQWSRAYPLTIFAEPDLKKARALLEAGGMTLDAVSADAMRHVVEGVGVIARRALEPKP